MVDVVVAFVVGLVVGFVLGVAAIVKLVEDEESGS